MKIESSPILINNNTDFLNQASINGWVGNGSKNNPVIIENINIVVIGSYSDAIRIQNSNVHFILKNSSLTSYGGNGLSLINSSNGILTNVNIVGGTYDGVHLESSFNNTISNCLISKNRNGIEIINSNDNIIENSSINYNPYTGLLLSGSDNNTISGNGIGHNRMSNLESVVGKGFQMTYSDNNTIEGNYISDSWWGFTLSNSYNNTISLNSIKKILFDVFDISNSNNNTFIGNTMAQNHRNGILMKNSNQNDFEYNFISDLIQDAFSIISCNLNEISSNYITKVITAMTLEKSSYNSIVNNTIVIDDTYGIYLDFYSIANNFSLTTVNGYPYGAPHYDRSDVYIPPHTDSSTSDSSKSSTSDLTEPSSSTSTSSNPNVYIEQTTSVQTISPNSFPPLTGILTVFGSIIVGSYIYANRVQIREKMNNLTFVKNKKLPKKGTRIISSTCFKCGSNLGPTDVFCFNCGEKIKEF